MFKLVVLSALLAIVAATPEPKPGFYGAAVAYTAPAVAVPSAVSYQARTDVISKPVIATTYAAHAPVVAAYSAPYAYGYGYAAAPAVAKYYGGYGYAAPLHYY